MEHYKALADIVDDIDAMTARVAAMPLEDVVGVLNLLVRRQKGRDESVRAYQAKKVAQLGVTPQWHHARTNPDVYAKRLAESREYKARKRAAAKTPGATQPPHSSSRVITP